MQYNQKTPCDQCPFRQNSAPGWLGDYYPEEIIQHLQQEIPFLCHKQIEEGPSDDSDWQGYAEPNWQEWAEANVDHCAGALIMQRKMCKLPRDQEHRKAVEAADKNYPILFPPQAFIDYHNNEWTKLRREHEEIETER